MRAATEVDRLKTAHRADHLKLARIFRTVRKKGRKKKKNDLKNSSFLEYLENNYTEFKDFQKFILEIINTNKKLISSQDVKYLIAVSALIAITELTIPFSFNLIYIDIIPARNSQLLIYFALVATSIMILGGWLKHLRHKIIANSTAKKEHYNKLALFNSILANRTQELSNKKAKLQNIAENLGLLEENETTQLNMMTIELLLSLIFLAILAFLSSILVVPVAISLYLFYKSSGKYGKEIQKIKEEENRYKTNESIFINEIATGAHSIKANGLTNNFISCTDNYNEDKLRLERHLGIREERFQSINQMISQTTYLFIACLGSIAVNFEQMSLATLATCLLLAGKIISPWQRLFTLRYALEKNKRVKKSITRLIGKTKIYKSIMCPASQATIDERFPIKKLHIKKMIGGKFQFECFIEVGKVVFIRDDSRGIFTDQLFRELSGNLDIRNLELNDGKLNISSLQEHQIIYVDPNNQVFEGTISQNISSFEPDKYFDRAVYWSVLLGVDKFIRRLPNGYETILGEYKESGLDSDTELSLSLIRALAKQPDYILINSHQHAYGENYTSMISNLTDHINTEIGVVISADYNNFNGLSYIESSFTSMSERHQGEKS